MKRLKLSAALCAATVFAVAVSAQEPAQNVNPYRHGNIAAAQDLTRQAFDRMTAAQDANEFDLGGHAGRAKSLLQQASAEMKQAAESANRR